MESGTHPLLENYRTVLTIPVQWGDQDAFQHVNNTIYLRWFESSRIVYCGMVGISRMYDELNIGPIMASITCHYRRPVVFPDTVLIGARVVKIGRTSFTMDHAVVSRSQDAVVADGTSTIVLFDYNQGRPHPIPDQIRSAIAAAEVVPLDPGRDSPERSTAL